MHWLFPIFLLAVSSISPVFGDVSCPKGFTLVNNKCIRVFTNKLNHGVAEKDCVYLGGTLVNIKNAIDNRAIATRAANSGLSSVWIGAFCFSTNPSDCYWDDASGPVGNYSNFAAGHPNIAAGYGGCVYMTPSSGQWYSASCQVIGMPFICEVPVTVPDDCPHNFNGNCYYPSTELSSTATQTHDNAQAFCTSQSMNLVSIHSKMEHDFIKTIYKSSNGPVNITQIYLGATSSLSSTWDDGTNWDFDYKDPLGLSGAENCLVMDVLGVGLWTEVSCDTVTYFMCKRRAGSSTAPEAVQQQQKTVQTLTVSNLDASHCNSNLILAPGIITSPEYPKYGTPLTSCTYALRALGPYHIGLYFTDFSTNFNHVYVYDEFDNLLGSYNSDWQPFSLIAPTNIVKVQFDVSTMRNVQRGFSATFLPIS